VPSITSDFCLPRPLPQSREEDKALRGQIRGLLNRAKREWPAAQLRASAAAARAPRPAAAQPNHLPTHLPFLQMTSTTW
jgi:hypothetical protein